MIQTEYAPEKFIQHLEMHNLSRLSIYNYMSYYLRFYKTMEQDGLTQNKVNEFIINHKGNKVCRAFMKHYLKSIDETTINIIKPTGRVPVRKPNHISKSELSQIIEWLDNNSRTQNYALMVLLTYSCGLRLQEVFDIKIIDFNLIEWREESNRGIKLKIHGKGNRDRYVIVPPHVMRALKPYILKRLEKINNPSEEKLFANASAIQRKFRKACKAVCHRVYRFHELRHTRSNDWYNEGKDILQIKQRLGHTSVATTQIYINPDEEKELENWRDENFDEPAIK